MEARLFEQKHRLIATEVFKVNLLFEDIMLMLFQASKQLHWSVAKHNVLAGEFTFATPRSYRCGGEIVYVKVQIVDKLSPEDMEDKEEEKSSVKLKGTYIGLEQESRADEICQVSMTSRPRRASTLFDFKKNHFNVTELKRLFNDFLCLDDESKDLTEQ